MICTIFYSWQRDLPNSTNRAFIESALEAALAELAADGSLVVEARIDSDTKGLPGSPDIVQAILDKIDCAAVFVGDVSIVHPEEVERRSPNPNVLVEHGWALKSLGPARVLPVMNTAFGDIGLLPFDLRQKRTVTYHLPEGQPKAAAKKELVGKLKHHLAEILKTLDIEPQVAPQPAEVAIAAIAENRPDQSSRVRAYMEWLGEALSQLDPHARPGDPEENLLVAIQETVPLVREFSRVVDAIASMKSLEAGRTLVRGFEHILKRYNLPAHVSGGFNRADFDLFKFAGHELFVTMVARLVREEGWSLLGQVLHERIYQTNVPNEHAGPIGWDALSEKVLLLEDIRAPRVGRISVHADLLMERHKSGPLSEIVPWTDFLAFDFLLYLASRPWRDGSMPSWRPWSFIFLKEAPRFLLESKTPSGAKHLLAACGEETSASLRARIAERMDLFAKLQRSKTVPFAERKLYFDPVSIAEV